MAAHHEFSFINIEFNSFNKIYKTTRLCPKEFRPQIWNLMNKHFHQHPLIPNISQQNLTADTIRKQAVLEIFFLQGKFSCTSMVIYVARMVFQR